MAQDTSGIMGLQEDYFSKGMLPPEMGLEVADGTMQNLNPQLKPAVDGLTSELSGKLAALSDEQLDIFIQLVQQLYDEPDNYAENRANLIKGGDLTEEDLPPDYQPEALAMILYVLRKEQQTRMGAAPSGPSTMPPMAGAAPQMMQPPQGFARGGIAEAARIVAGSGRNGDTMLAHITPREAKLLRKHGGSGTINPVTGLREYGFFSFLRDIWQAVWKPIKGFLNTTVGKIVSQVALNILIPGFGSIIASGLQTAAAGGDFGDIVKSMAISTATSWLSGGLAKQGMPSPIQGPLDSLANNLSITSDVGKMALNQGVVTAGMGLVTGKGAVEAAKEGLMAAGMVHAADFGSKLMDNKPSNAPIEDRSTLPADGRSRTLGADADIPMPSAEVSSVLNKPQPYVGSLEGIDVPYQGKLAGVDYPYGTKPPTGPVTEADLLASRSTTAPPVVSGSSTNMQSGANAGTSTAAPYKPVEIGDALSTMGRGTKQILTGDVSEGFNNLTQGGKDLFFPSSPSVTNILDSDDYKTAVSRGMDPKLAYAEVSKKLEPGFMRTYGPGAAAGLGIMAMAGGFEQPGQEGGGGGPQFRGPTGEDLLKQNPNKYLVQGLPGVQYDAQGNIIGNKEQYPYYGMQDIQVGSRFTGAPTYFSEGGEVEEPEYLAVGGMPGMSPNVIQNLTNFYMRFRGKPMPGFPRTPEIGVPNIGQSGITMGGLAGVAAKMKAQRDAKAAAAAQAAATAAANAPGQENKLYAANPEQYRPNMQEPVRLAYGGLPANSSSRGGYGILGDPDSPQRMEYRAMAQSLTPAARQYMASRNNNGAIADMNMMREAMAYSAREEARRAPAQENALYAANPEKYRPNMTRPDAGIAGLAMGGYPRKTGQISGPGTETSDSIPAMLSDGEFVMTAKAVRGLGQGSRREGAKKMYALMHQLERNAARG